MRSQPGNSIEKRHQIPAKPSIMLEVHNPERVGVANDGLMHAKLFDPGLKNSKKKYPQ